MARESKYGTVTLRLTEEQRQWIDEVREYVQREGRTAFGPPDVSDRDAVALLVRAGYRSTRRKMRKEPEGTTGPDETDPDGDGKNQR